MRTPKIPAGRATGVQAAAAGQASRAGPASGEAESAAVTPGQSGGLRGAASRAAGAIRPGLRRHWLIAVLLLAGLVLRLLAEFAYRPVLFYIDSTKYLYHAGGNDPVGYRVPLRLILLVANLDTVAAVQHLLGLAMGALVYAVLVRRGCARWLAALAAAPVLLDAYQLQIEQTIMPDVWFEALIVIALALLLWRPQPSWWMIAAAGVALGLSATVAQAGEILVLPAVVYVLVAVRGWRRALGGAGLACVSFALPIVAYMSVAAAVTGHFWLSNAGTGGLYGRVAAAADCATLRVPASQRALCPTPAQKAALGDDGLEHSPVSPVRRYYAQLPPAEASHTVSAFTRAVLTQQPLNVASAIERDTLKLFAVQRVTRPGDTPVSRWQFQASYPYYSPHATPREVDAAIRQFGGGAPAVTGPLARFLRAYQLDGGYTPGPLYVLAVLAGLIGSLCVFSRRGAVARRAARGTGIRGAAAGRSGAPGPGGRGDRSLALACLLFFVTGVAVLLVRDILEFSWRYQLEALITLPPAGALGLMVIAGRIRSRRGGQAAAP